MRRFGSMLLLKLNPKNFRSTGRATALFVSFTLSFSRRVRNRVTFFITRCLDRELDRRHQFVVIDPVKEFFKIQVYHPAMACGDVLLCLGYRLMRRAFRPEPVTVFGECGVPSALQNLHHRLLDQSIQHRRDTKLSHPAVRFRDFHPSHRLWLVGPTQQLFPYGGPVLLQVAREFSDFYAVDSRTSFVRFDSLISLPAVFPLADFFHQLLVTSWTFGFAFRRKRFGPFLKSLRSFTPLLLSEGQH